MDATFAVAAGLSFLVRDRFESGACSCIVLLMVNASTSSRREVVIGYLLGIFAPP